MNGRMPILEAVIRQTREQTITKTLTAAVPRPRPERRVRYLGARKLLATRGGQDKKPWPRWSGKAAGGSSKDGAREFGPPRPSSGCSVFPADRRKKKKKGEREKKRRGKKKKNVGKRKKKSPRTEDLLKKKTLGIGGRCW